MEIKYFQPQQKFEQCLTTHTILKIMVKVVLQTETEFDSRHFES